MLFFEHARVFFPRFLLSRNYKIQIVARVEGKSAVALSGIVEASCSHFFIGRVLLSRTIEIYPDKKTRVGSLHTPREYDDRLPPDAGYYLDLVIPRKEESREKNTCMFE